MNKLLTVLMLLFLSTCAFCQKEFLFLDLKHKKGKAIIGKYDLPKFKKVDKQSVSLHAIEKEVDFFQNGSAQEVLIYIHGMWANEKYYHRGSLKTIQKYISDHPTIEKVIAIEWHAPAMSYSKNWRNTNATGRLLENWLLQWMAEYDGKTNIFCHSMGHRFFQGMIAKNPQLQFNKVIFAAPDINSDEFARDLTALANADKILVFRNKKDRLLKASRRRLKQDRMGLQGISDQEIVVNQYPVKLIDVTEVKNDKADLTRHSYFKRSKEVREIITAFLAE